MSSICLSSEKIPMPAARPMTVLDLQLSNYTMQYDTKSLASCHSLYALHPSAQFSLGTGIAKHC